MADHDTHDHTGIPGCSSGGGAVDPIEVMFGTPDTSFEFDTSSLAGLTAMGTPDTEDADTSVPDAYYLADNASGTAWCGRYVTIPAYSFTAVLKVLAINPKANYNRAGLFVSVATPGKIVVLEYGLNTKQFDVETFSDPTTYSSSQNSGMQYVPVPCWLGVVATSTSNVTFYGSMDGYVWQRVQSAYDPSMTIGSVGFGGKSENGGGVAMAFDYFRIWNSSKTFLTGV